MKTVCSSTKLSSYQNQSASKVEISAVIVAPVHITFSIGAAIIGWFTGVCGLYEIFCKYIPVDAQVDEFSWQSQINN